MILGSFSLTADTSPITERICAACSHPKLKYFPLVFSGFSGGFFLNGSLPWKPDDFVYSSPDDDIVVLMSGDIYNRHEFTGTGENLSTSAAPALVARLFLSQGPGFVSELNGDFAIFILRPLKKQAFLYRDHVGIRPLAYTYNNQILSFSSDFIGLSRASCSGEGIDEDYFLKYFRYADYRKLPCGRVIKMPPGHYIELSDKGIRTTKYWKPEEIKTDHNLKHEQMITDLGSLLKDAVHIRCDRRFTAGAHLSGGLDSGIVAALARKEYASQVQFHGLSWSPRGSEATGANVTDERELVTKTAGKAGIHPVFCESTIDKFTGAWASFYEYFNFHAEYITSDVAVESGINLVFSGWGGDEFISTGVTAMESDLLRELRLGLFLRHNLFFRPKLFVKRVIYCVVFPALGILDRPTARALKNDAYYLRKEFGKSDRKMIRDFHFNTSRRIFHLRMLEFYHLQQRCEDWARGGYRNGLEYRYPLLDRRIIEYMIGVPSVLLCKTDEFRPVLRILGKELLPGEVLRNYSKRDPVYIETTRKLFRDAVRINMDEAESWKSNPDLHFVDFALLEKDIAGYRGGSKEIDEERLARTLTYLKGIHEFSKRYHEKVEAGSGE